MENQSVHSFGSSGALDLSFINLVHFVLHSCGTSGSFVSCIYLAFWWSIETGWSDWAPQTMHVPYNCYTITPLRG
jgi:hypothetical protein